MDNVMLRLVHITHHVEHRFLIHIEQGHDADDLLLAGIIGSADQLHGWDLFPVALLHPRTQFIVRDFAEAMVVVNNVGF